MYIINRPIQIEDRTWIHAALSENQVSKYTSSIPYPLPENFTENWIKEWVSLIDCGSGMRLVAVNSSNEGLGSASVMKSGASTGELAAWVAPQHWRKGVARFMASELIDDFCSELNICELYTGHFADNEASKKFICGLGFEPTGEVVKVYSIARQETLAAYRYKLQL